MRRSTVLISGFEPFGGEAINPSLEIARRLDGWRPDDRSIVAAVELPCVFGLAIDRLRAAVDSRRPSVVLALGLAASRSDISVERVAVNIDDARMPDNAGHCPIDEPVIAGAPAAYFSTLPIKAIVSDLIHAGIPASVSQTAGTYVCNHLFFGLSHLIARRKRRGIRGGFIHLPRLAEPGTTHADAPGLPLELMDTAVRRIVQTVLATSIDLRAPGGAID